MSKEEQIRAALETYDTETVKDALSLLLGKTQNSVVSNANTVRCDVNFSNFAQAVSWLKSRFKFQELDAFSTEADLVYVDAGDRKILLTDTSVKPREKQAAYSFHSMDEFENAWENILPNKKERYTVPENAAGSGVIQNEGNNEVQDECENAFEPRQKNERFSNLEL